MKKILLVILLYFAVKVLTDEVREFRIMLPPSLSLAAQIREVDHEDNSLGKGELGFIFMGSRPAGSEYTIGMVNAFMLENYRNHHVYGLYSGVFSNAQNVKGIQVTLLSATRKMSGFQVAIANFNNISEGFHIAGLLNIAGNRLNGIQISPINIVGYQYPDHHNMEQTQDVEQPQVCSFQIGIVNQFNKEQGAKAQIGLINKASGKSIQFGLLNINKDSIIPYCPLLRICF